MLPRLRLLGYQATRPHLRLIRLPEAEFEPSPVPLNGSPTALDHCIRREGWIAFRSEEVWGVPIPLEGKAFRVGKSFDFLPSRNERAIWMMDGHPPWDAPCAYVEYDGVARAILDRIELPRGLQRLQAVTETGFIVTDGQGASYSWERGASTSELVREEDTEMAFQNPLGGRWTPLSESPDGRYRAFDIDVTWPREPESFAEVIHEIVQGRATYEPVPHRLALVDRADGQVTLLEGEFDNFATSPVWSDDGEWLVFAAPFTPRGLWTCRVADARLEWINFGRSTPVPRVNVSDLISD